jgi:hypothetical protein
LFADKGLARESMFRLGYNNCIACHSSPRGGQFLTQYGQLISNSLSVKKKELQGVKVSKLSQRVKARLAHVRTEYSNDTFPMQADYLAAFSLPKGQVLASLARAPQRNSVSDTVEEPSTIETLYLRELKYLVSSMGKQFTIGREQQNLGLTLEDHTVFSKSENRFNVTDLATVFSMDSLGKNFNYSFHVFAPSFQEKRTNREYGAKTEIDYTINMIQLGFGLLAGLGDSIDRYLMNVNSKIRFSKQLLMQLEGTFTNRSIETGGSFKQQAYLAILSYFPIESLELFTQLEKLNREDPFEVTTDRIGLGANLKLYTHLSWRTDWKRTKLSQRDEDLYISQLYLNWW